MNAEESKILNYLAILVSLLGVVSGTDLEETLARLSSGPDTFRAHSSLQKWTEEGFGPDYFTFGEVKLDNGTLLYYNPNKTTELPAEIWLNLHESVITLPVRQIQVAEGGAPVCTHYFEAPALLMAGTLWDSNFYEMMVNNVMIAWATARSQSLLQPDRYLEASNPPESGKEAFLMIQARRSGYDSPWAYIFDYMTPNQVLWEKVDGSCFKQLTVVSTSMLRFIHPRDFQKPAHKALYKYKQQKLLQEFQRWLFLVEALYQRLQGTPKPSKLADSVGYSRPRVVFSSRPVRPGVQSRGVTNEDEVVRFIQKEYDVNVTLVEFHGSLETAIQLVQSCSLFIGMHGAGLTHNLWLRPGSHFLQLAPYGFSPDGMSLIRGNYFDAAAKATMSTSSHWVNPHPHKAFFHQENFEEEDGQYFEQPDQHTPTPVDWNAPKYWIYQSTEVDVSSFGVALEHAMRQINVPKRRRGAV